MTNTRNIFANPYPSPLVLVEEFHLTYGQKVRITPHIDIPERGMRIALIEEEVQELADAAADHDIIEVVDALADILYVTYGAAIAHGIAIDHELGNGTLHNSVGPTVKLTLDSEGTPLPEVPFFNEVAIATEIPHIRAAFNDYATNSNEGDIRGLTNALVRLIISTYSLAFKIGVDVDDVLEEVQRSNMSKLGEDGLPIVRADGKILKGPGFFVPDVAAILTRQGWNGKS